MTIGGIRNEMKRRAKEQEILEVRNSVPRLVRRAYPLAQHYINFVNLIFEGSSTIGEEIARLRRFFLPLAPRALLFAPLVTRIHNLRVGGGECLPSEQPSLVTTKALRSKDSRVFLPLILS